MALQTPDYPWPFRRRRFINWFALGLTYACLYMGRYNLNASSSVMMDMFHLTKEEFGAIGTAGFWTYALSLFINAPLADRFGGRRAIIVGAFGAALMNLIIGLLFLSGWQTKVVVGMSLLYGVNSYFQSFGAVSVVKVNASWFHVHERGRFGGIFGIMISSGYFLALTVGGWILAGLPWYFVFLIPSLALAVMGLVDYFQVVNAPSDSGFSDINTGDATADDADKDEPITAGYILRRVLKNRVILILAASEFCTGFVRQGILLWFVPFLKQVHHVEHGTALFSVASVGVTVGGICGGLICGYLSDHVFQSRRPPVAFIFYLCQIVSLYVLGHVSSPAAASFMIGFTCTWIFGVHGMLSGTASMDFGGTKAAGTVTGMLDGIQYVASGLTGFLLGHFLDQWGWGVWTWIIMPFSAIGAVLMVTIWDEKPRPAAKPKALTNGAQST